MTTTTTTATTTMTTTTTKAESDEERTETMWKDRQGRTGVTKSDQERAIEQKCDGKNAEALQF